MSSELKKEVIKTGKMLKEVSSEQRIDMDITLPDYCADIKKILRCSIIPGLHSVSLSGERASAKGTGMVRVIYLAEGEKTDAFEKTVELSSAVQLKETSPDAVVTAHCAVDFVNCRAVSQRKISISSSVSTIFSLYGCCEDFFAVDDKSDGVQTKKEKLVCENHLGFSEKTFDLGETVSLAGEHPPVGKIISCTSRVVNPSHKLSGGKLLVKGDAVTDICYIPEKSENGIHTLSHTMPISQIIDLRDVPDTASCTLNLKVCQSLCTIKADSSGSNRLVDVALRVSALVHAFEKKECEVITDCYCTGWETEQSFEYADILCPVREISETNQAKGELQLSSGVREVCFVRCLDISKNVKYTEDKVQLDCSALVLVMYVDDKGVPCIAEKNLDFDFSYSVVKKCTQPFGSFTVDAFKINAAVSTGDKLEVTIDCLISGRVYCKCQSKLLKSLKLLKDKPKKGDSAALTIYFAEKNESLWDIAKSHNTTVELIMGENGINTEAVKEKVMLLIPCADL